MIPETLKNVKLLGEFIIHKQHQAIVSPEFDYLEFFKLLVTFGQTTIKTRTVAARPGVNCVRVRKVKGKKGVIREQHDLIVNIDLVRSSFRYKIYL